LRQLLIGIALLAVSLTSARADGYPDRPITLVVPYAAGGTTDVLGRLLAKALGAELKQTVIVENVGGAGGTLGTQRVVRAKPDGYTLNFGNMGSMAASVPLYPMLGFDTRKDLVGIGVFANVPMMISVSKKSGINSLGELIARLKEQSGRVTFGHSGASSTAQLAAAMLLYLTETKATLVPWIGARHSGPYRRQYRCSDRSDRDHDPGPSERSCAIDRADWSAALGSSTRRTDLRRKQCTEIRPSGLECVGSACRNATRCHCCSGSRPCQVT
jgi:Tripartite tricarboxylate transporter family receptor